MSCPDCQSTGPCPCWNVQDLIVKLKQEKGGYIMKCPNCGKDDFVQQSEQHPRPHKIYVCLDCGYKEKP